MGFLKKGSHFRLAVLSARDHKYIYMTDEFFLYIDGNFPFFRKLCRDCKKVLDYLAISEVIETMEDLVQFVKDLR